MHTDLNGVEFNEFCEPDMMEKILNLRGVGMRRLTQISDDQVKSVSLYMEYAPRCWIVSIAMTKDFKMKDAKELRRHLYDGMLIHDAERVQTDSQDDETLNRWHKFLGFTLEGTRKKFMNGLDYNMWGITNGD